MDIHPDEVRDPIESEYNRKRDEVESEYNRKRDEVESKYQEGLALAEKVKEEKFTYAGLNPDGSVPDGWAPPEDWRERLVGVQSGSTGNPLAEDNTQ